MPEQSTIRRAREDQRQGKSASTQAGEFVREQFHHIREGKHGARSTRQAIAIGLSEARRSGVKLPPPPGKASPKTAGKARRESSTGQPARGIRAPRTSATRSRATLRALRREGQAAASTRAISRQTRASARRRSPEDRSASAHKAAQTRKARR